MLHKLLDLEEFHAILKTIIRIKVLTCNNHAD